MVKLRGITVMLIDKQVAGTDPFQRPIYEDVEIPVENVLVSPTSTDDIISSQEIYGKKAVYTLAIPKGDNHLWEDREVKFFGKKWRVFGSEMQGIDDLIPLDWNKKVMVEKYE